jgi:hypothetical protein
MPQKTPSRTKRQIGSVFAASLPFVPFISAIPSHYSSQATHKIMNQQAQQEFRTARRIGLGKGAIGTYSALYNAGRAAYRTATRPNAFKSKNPNPQPSQSSQPSVKITKH